MNHWWPMVLMIPVVIEALVIGQSIVVQGGHKTDRRWLTLWDIDKQVYMWRSRPCWPSQHGGWPSHGEALEDLVIERSRTDNYAHWDHGGGIVNTLLQRGLVVCPLKPLAVRFWLWPQNPVGVLARTGGSTRGIIAKLPSRQSKVMRSL
jgi:hypothetical protein